MNRLLSSLSSGRAEFGEAESPDGCGRPATIGAAPAFLRSSRALADNNE
jgi:hypothetical protein